MQGRARHPHLRLEHVVEALQETRGFIYSAKRYIKNKWGYDVSEQTITTCIKEENMYDWLDEIRKLLVEDCMSKAFYKAVKEGDNHCIFWILNKYKHHINFLEAKEEDAPEKVPGEIAEFMTVLKEYNANPTTKPAANIGISEQQCQD